MNNPEYVITAIMPTTVGSAGVTGVQYMFFPNSQTAYGARRALLAEGRNIRFGKFDESFKRIYEDSCKVIEVAS